MAWVQDVAGDMTTVDHSDMRGLVTDLTWFRRGAARSLRSWICPGFPERHIGWSGVLLTGLPHPEPKPLAGVHARALLPWALPEASQAMAQMNPTNSRATAVVTSLLFLPCRVSAR